MSRIIICADCCFLNDFLPHIQQSSHRREQTHYSCHVKILSTTHDGFINMWPGGVTDMPGKSYAISIPRIASRALKRFGLSINNPSLKVSADTVRIWAAGISPWIPAQGKS